MAFKSTVRRRVRKALKKYVKGQLASKNNPPVKLPAKWTPAKVRVDDKGNVQVKISAGKVGSGRVARGIKSVNKA